MRSSPIQVGTGFYRTLALGNNSTMAIDPYGTLTAWGENLYGQAGINSITTYSWTQLSNGNLHSLALRSDGILFAWGLNTSGQLGTGDTINRQSPTQISGSYTQISAGLSNSYAISSDGTLWAWGDNASGQLPSVSQSRSSPVQIGIGTQYSVYFTDTQALSVSYTPPTGNFTLEAWVYVPSLATGKELAWFGSTDASSRTQFSINTTGTVSIEIYVTGVVSTTTGTISLNTWAHIAFVRTSTTLVTYINGSSSASITLAGTLGTVGSMYIGNNSLLQFTGGIYISNFRFVNGTAVYTGNFTVPTSALSTIQSSSTNIVALSGTETVILTCQNDTLIDNSINASTVTGYNTPRTDRLTVPFTQSNTFNSNWSLVSAGKLTNYALAIRSNRLYAWGNNANYTLGDGTSITRISPTQIGTSSWSQISAGGSHSLAIDINNLLYTWGLNSSGQAAVTTRPGWSFIAGGYGTTNMTGYGIRTDGRLFGWGLNNYGQLGDGSTTNKSSPVQIGTDYKYVDIGSNANAGTMFAIKTDGTAWAMGNGNNGLLGNGFTVHRSNPVQVLGSISWTMISVNSTTLITTGVAAGIDTTGKLYTWGSGTNGQLGDGFTTNNRSAPVQIAVDKSWSTVSLAGAYALAITTTGTLWAWGRNTNGELGDGTVVNKSSPVQIGSGNSWTSVYASTSFAVAMKLDNSIWGWGINTYGQLAQGDTTTRNSPVQIGSGTSWTSVAVSDSTLFLRKNDGTIWASGLAASSQLSNGSTVDKSNLTLVSNLPATESWNIYPRIPTNAGLAVRASDNTLWVWGSDNGSQLGLNVASAIYTSPVPQFNGPESIIPSPTQIGTNSWTKISAGYSHSLAITSTGTLYSWGNNLNGQLAITTYSYISIGAGFNKSSVIRNDNSIWTWGLGTSGQLGDGTTVTKSSPVIIVAKKNWKTVINSSLSDFALTTDNKLFAWGDNTSGAIGDGTTVNRSSPVQVGTSSWTMVATGGSITAGQQTVYAIRSDGALFSWGNNTNGQVGSGAQTPVNVSPVQIGTSSWSLVTAGNQFALAITTDGKLFAWGQNNVGQLGITPSAISWSQISTGTYHSLAIRSDGRLFAWGYNSDGQLGNNTTIGNSSPIQIASGSYTQIAGSQNSSYAIKSDGSLWAWGNNSQGQLGQNNTVARSSPTQIGNSSWSLVSSNNSGYYALATRSDGALFGWGQNLNSVIGSYSLQTPGFYNVLSPVQVTGGGSWIAISAGGQHALGIKSDNNLYAWGLGTTGQTARAGGVFSWVQIATGGAHTAAIRDDGALFMWGRNSDGQLGNSEQGINSVNKSSPVQIGASSWSQVSIGASHSLAIRADGTLWSWGINNVGQLGLSDSASRSSPVQIGTANTWTKVIAGNNSSFAIRSDFSLYAWGVNTDGVLGDGTVATKNSPVQVITPVVSWSQVACGDNIAAGIDYLGRLYTWGYNLNGQLGGAGNGSTAGSILSRSSPSQVGADSWISIGVGYNVMTGIKTGGTMWSWGNNSNGEFGDGSTITALRSSPVQIGAANTWSSVTGGAQSALVGIFHAITTSNILWAWGDGSRVGDNTVVARSSMVLVSGGGTYIKALSGTHPLAITTTYALQVWGSNTAGEIGDGTINNRSAPLQIGTSTPTILSSPAIIGNSSWTSVSAGDSHSMAIRSDGTLWAWGKNTDGQLGLTNINAAGDTVNRSSPVQIGTSSWTKVSAGLNHTMALRLDSGLFTWGFNTQGQLGSGVATPRSSPVQVNAGTSYSQISSGASNSLAIDNTSKVYGWGYGPFGQLGDLTATTRSAPFQIGTSTSTIEQSPVQVGSSSWTQITAGASHSVGIKADTTVFAWGLNTSGQVGDNTIVSRSSPVQLGTVSSALTNATAYSVQLNGTNQSITTSAQTSSTYFGTGDFTIETWVNLTSTPARVGSGTFSINYDGVGSYSTTSSLTSANYLGSGDFTIEAWVYLNSTPAQNASIICGGSTAGSDWQISWSTSGFCFMPDGSVRKANTNNIAAMSNTTWYHVAFTRASGTLYSFLNGTIISAGVAETGNYTGTSGMIIGANRGRNTFLPGKISNLRVIKGQAIFTGNFTPSITPLTSSTIGHTGSGAASSLSGTVVLLTAQNNNSQSNNLVDNSSSAFTFTTVSGYIIDNNVPSTIYDYASIISITNNWQWAWNNDIGAGFNFMTTEGPTNNLNTGALSLNTWYHIAVQRVSGTLSVWVNGVNTGTNVTDTTSFTSLNGLKVGIGKPITSPAYLPGYLSNLRITKGQGLFTVGQIFTPSTTPLTYTTIGHTGTGAASSLTGTVVLLTLQNQASVLDNSSTGFTFTLSNSPTIGSLVTPFTSAIASGAINASKVGAGGTHSVAIDTNNKLLTWGDNTNSQLGLNDVVARSAPTQVGLKNYWNNLSVGSDHTLATDTNGTLYAWGLNTAGQLGDNTLTTRNSPITVQAITLVAQSSPIQIGTSSWTQISAGNNFSIALSNTNKLFAWGLGTQGQLGMGLTIARSSPTQVSTLNSYNLISAGGTHAMFIPTTSPQLILATGFNTSGQLGLSTTISRSSPVQVAASNSSFNSPVTISVGNYSSYYNSSPVQVGNSSWTQVSAGGTHTIGIKTDNTLYAWGYNANGQLADSTTINKSSPVQVGTSSWSQVSAGDSHNIIAKSDGTINTFGLNTFGQLGDGT